jgi:hypothetical protein
MLPIDTFLTLLYVLVDDFCRNRPDDPDSPKQRSRRPASLSESEVITLSAFGQLARFQSERDFYRFAHQRLRHLFPRLPDRSQFNRLQRQHQESMLAFSHYLVDCLEAREGSAYEVLDRCGVETRWCGRRGVGWLPEYTDKGKCSRLGFFHGFHLLTACTPEGIITGFSVGPASCKDQPQAEALFYARESQDQRCPCAGKPCSSGVYVADTGFTGDKRYCTWRDSYGARVLCPPQPVARGKKPRKVSQRPWSKEWRYRHASLRQMVETVQEQLLNAFRLAKERPHEMRGFFARLSAKVVLHNFCAWVNRSLGRGLLQVADLIGW